MKLLVIAATLSLVLSGCSAPQAPSAGETSAVTETSDSTFKKDVLLAKVPVLVDFYATWCGPCKMMAPVIDQLSVQYKGKIKVVRLDVDQSPGVASALGIQSLPTIAIFKNGKPVEAAIGVTGKDVLSQKIEEALKL